MEENLEKRIIDLESQLAFMQVTVDALNSVVTKQQDQIDDLKKRFREVQILAGQSSVEKDGDTKPPHY